MIKQENKVEVAVYQQRKNGESYCGDSYYYQKMENKFICVLVDGLGSGKFAAESSQAVIEIFRENIHKSNDELMKIMNKQLVGKRGVVLGILEIDFNSNIYTFSSIGNVGMMIVFKDKRKRRNIPNAGYIASHPCKFKVLQESLENEMNFIMFSDGVTDTELSKQYILNKDVNDLVKTYSYLNGAHREDDTTLIAMRYVKKHFD